MRAGKQNLEHLKANSICQGFVYLQMNAQRLLLSHPGSWIDDQLFKKFEQLQHKLDYQSVVDETLKENFKKLLNDHLKLEFENEVASSGLEILSGFAQMIKEDHNYLNWSVACFECFNKISDQEIILFHETDINLLRKAHLSASIAVWLSLGNGLYDPAFLEDIYHLTFLQDSGLINAGYSYYITEALDQESMIPGQGIKFLLKENAGENEIKLFKDHPFASYEYIKELNLLRNKELANTVLLGHELKNGEGFPFGYTGEVLASWEKILILADQLVRYNSTLDYNLINELDDLRASRIDLIPVRRILSKSVATLNYKKQKVSA